jgi:anti-sigma-K factor RskA
VLKLQFLEDLGQAQVAERLHIPIGDRQDPHELRPPDSEACNGRRRSSVPVAGPHTDLGGYVLGHLEPEERARFERHLEACAACQEEAPALGVNAGLLPRAGASSELPPALGARVVAAVEEEAAADGVGPSTATPRGRGLRSWRRLLVPAAAAASLVIAVLVGVRLGDGPSGPLEVDAVLSPHGGGAARARAEVVETGFGRVITFRSDDLPILPKGEFYELWFVGPGDTPEDLNRISAGTFHPDAEGRSSVRFAAAVDPSRYPVLCVTAQPGDGDPAPSGDEVMRSSPRR